MKQKCWKKLLNWRDEQEKNSRNVENFEYRKVGILGMIQKTHISLFVLCPSNLQRNSSSQFPSDLQNSKIHLPLDFPLLAFLGMFLFSSQIISTNEITTQKLLLCNFSSKIRNFFLNFCTTFLRGLIFKS